MLRYKEVFRPTRLKGEKAVRCRVLGSTHDDKLLVLINTTSQTAIEAVSSDGSSVTVMSFKKYKDLVNAHLSADHELCHITERVPSNKGFSFISTIYHIFGNAKSKEINSDQPVVGFFLPEVQNGVYQMIHIIGNRLTHLKVELQKRSINMEKLRGGVHIPNLISYKFNHKESLLTAIYKNDKADMIAIFDLGHGNLDSTKPEQIIVMPSSVLPYELAMNPLAQLHIPYFRNATNRFFVTHKNNKYCVIQQIFDGPDANLTFCVSTYPQPFNQFIRIPNVQPDLPLCFAQFSSIILVFVPNEFVCVVDSFINPPSITVLPKPLAMSLCGSCCTTLPLPHMVIDVDTSEIFEVDFNFANCGHLLKSINKSAWSAFAHIAARTLSAELLADLLSLLQTSDDPTNVAFFVRDFLGNFSVTGQRTTTGFCPPRSQSTNIARSLPKIPDRTLTPIQPRQHKLPRHIRESLDEIEKEFPSSGPISRRRAFKDALKAISSNRTKSVDAASRKALQLLRRQNEAALFIRDALDVWIARSRPPEHWLLAVELTLASEAAFASFPGIPCLREELTAVGSGLLSQPMQRQLESVGVAAPGGHSEAAEFWLDRIDLEPNSESDSSTASSARVFRRRDGSELSANADGSESGSARRLEHSYNVL